jgi:TonB family protein
LRSRFVLGSILLHLVLVLLLVKGLPARLSGAQKDAASPPLTVTLLDPDVVNELLLGPTTHLPSTPKNLEVAPLGRSAPIVRSAPSRRTEMTVRGRETGRGTAALGDPTMILPPAAGREPSQGSGAGPLSPPSTTDHSDGAVPPHGLPFVCREEIDRLAKLFTDQPKSKAPYEVNTEDLQYLSYIAQIARTLELIWTYPKEAGDLGQQGVTVLKITILEDGTLQASELMQSSGYRLLDGEALRAVKRLAPYQPLPKSWHRSEWDLTISFTYVLYGVAVNVI